MSELKFHNLNYLNDYLTTVFDSTLEKNSFYTGGRGFTVETFN